ncbi:MAG: septum formation protein Maf [Deltaproteobacteria bacterium]|nr:septum formation protein Maf [Deltaproteobacteria bacterium]
MNQIALASTSPRRRSLLESLGFELTLLKPDIDESEKPGENPEELVLRLAREKVQAVASQTKLPLIAADTLVVLGDEILGKPDNAEHAYEMIEKLSGRSHDVLSGFAVAYQDKLINKVVKSTLVFRKLFKHEIEDYVKTREWEGKSGACTLQGASGPFVDHMTGSFTNVLGLPLTEVLEALRLVTPTGFEPVFTA